LLGKLGWRRYSIMRMLITTAVAPSAPREGSLLRDSDHHHAEATLALGDEPLDCLHVLPADPPENRRREIGTPRSSRNRMT